MAFAPLEGWRGIKATDRRIVVDRTQYIRDLAGSYFPGKQIALAMDNLNTHRAGSPCEAVPFTTHARPGDDVPRDEGAGGPA